MTWERFGYICRKTDAECSTNKRVALCLKEIEGEDACKLYGETIPLQSQARKILDELGAMKDEQSARSAITIYKDLSLKRNLELPMRFKHVFEYLIAITVVLFVVASIYQIYVLPSFMELFANFDVPLPPHLVLYQQYWGYFAVVIAILLILSLLIGSHIKSLFDFKRETGLSFISKYLLFPGIRNSQQRVISILRYPITAPTDAPNATEDKTIITHLRSVQNSRMSVSVEMQNLIDIEIQTLIKLCERQMKTMVIFIASIVAFAIFHFLVSAYSPITMIGDTI